MEAAVAQALFTLAMLLIFGGFLFWALRTRQFHDVEEANRRLFGDEPSEAEAAQSSVETGSAGANREVPK